MRFLNWPVQAHQLRLKNQSANAEGSEDRPPDPETDPSTTQTATAQQNIVLHTEPQASHRSQTAVLDHRFLNQVFPSGRSSPIVVAASDELQRRSIRPGLTLVEARSLDSEETSAKPKLTRSSSTSPPVVPAIFRAWSSDDDRQQLIQTAELFRQFAPLIAVDSTPVPDCLLLDVTGCGVLFGGEVPLAEQLLKVAGKAGLGARVAISESVASAWAFTHPSGHSLLESPSRTAANQPRPGQADWNLPLIVIPPGQAATWLSELPVAAGRTPIEDIELLKRLGVRSLKQLFALPADDLPSRISDDGRLRLRQLRGLDDELLDALPEANPVQSLWVSEYGVQGKEHIKLVFQVLVEDVVRQLKLRNLGATQATCVLTTEQSGKETVTASVVKAVQTEEELLDVLNLKLETVRIRDTVMSAKMQLVTAPLPIRRQKDLFSTDDHIHPEEELTSLINRLSSRLSSSAVTTVEETSSPVPEQSIQKHPVVDQQPTGGRRNGPTVVEQLTNPDLSPDDSGEQVTSLPIRLLARPVEVSSAATNPLRDGFRWEGEWHQVASAQGPQRIQSRWWDEEAVHRDYYRVTTTSGSMWWLFQDLKTRTWLLHGVFD